MTVLLNILYIIVFLLFLTLLICIHELGHLASAKIFNVYCFEFSIGFGPKLFRKKRINGETYFSLRAVPFGGYVSMYGEGAEVPEDLEIDESRSLNKIHKGKRAIILVAGVFMNAVLAFVLLFIGNVCFPTQTTHLSNLKISSDNYIGFNYIENNQTRVAVSSLTFENTDMFTLTETYDDTKALKSTIHFAKENGDLEVYAVFTGSSTDWNELLHFYWESYDTKNNVTYYYDVLDSEHPSPVCSDLSLLTSVDLNMSEIKYYDEETNTFTYQSICKTVPYTSDGFGVDLGIKSITRDEYASFGKRIKTVFSNYGKYSVAIVSGFKALFTDANSWSQMGGIVAIGSMNSSILAMNSPQIFLNFWAMISINLAIVNLFPFPGLDGWQLLVVIVEAIAHKEIPNKVKSIVSFVGIAILFALMILLVFKDVGGLITGIL